MTDEPEITSPQANAKRFKRLAVFLGAALVIVAVGFPSAPDRAGADDPKRPITLPSDVEVSGTLKVKDRNVLAELDSFHTRIKTLEDQLKTLDAAKRLKNLEDGLMTIEGQSLRIASFPLLLLSRDTNEGEAKKYAGTPAGGGVYIVIRANPDGRPIYLHPDAYGKKVAMTWWTPDRQHSHDYKAWGFLVARPGGPKGNQVEVVSSAGPTAGFIQGRVFVLYSAGP